MNEFLTRQIAVSRQLIKRFRSKNLELNNFIQNMTGLGEVIENEKWDELIYPIIWSMEEVNAFSIEKNMGLTSQEKISIENSIFALETAIEKFEIDQLR